MKYLTSTSQYHIYIHSPPEKKNLSLNSKGIKIYVQQKYIKNYHHFKTPLGN